jgi:hypothetical protein
MRFDPMEPENISYFDINTGSNVEFDTDGVLGCDGNIYTLTYFGEVLKIDTSACTVSVISNKVVDRSDGCSPIVGPDQCIYWSQHSENGILRFDPVTQELTSSPLGLDHGNALYGWRGGALADDGIIYYAPYCARRVLAVDSFRELSVTFKDNMTLYPQQLGRLFVQTGE